MNSSILQVGFNDVHDTPEICVLSPVSVCNNSSNSPSKAAAESIANIPKTYEKQMVSKKNKRLIILAILNMKLLIILMMVHVMMIQIDPFFSINQTNTNH